jgi:nucleotide-binding universal stress UspA family protein
MRILIGYDGSDSANAAIADLPRAGLPAEADLCIISTSEVVLPPPLSFTLPSNGTLELQGILEENALGVAREAAERIRPLFPNWRIDLRVHAGSPANAIIDLADEWQPDLIILGSHGRSRLGRFILGSVSQAVLNEAHCSVRIVHGEQLGEQATPTGPVVAGPLRLLVGIDGSALSEKAVEGIARRSWPAGTVVRLLNADFHISSVATGPVLVAITDWVAAERTRIAAAVESARQSLAAAGLVVETVVKPGDPRELLLAEAEEWQPHTIFVGARDLTRGGRLRLGSVSAAIAARAQVPVEVVRLPRQ